MVWKADNNLCDDLVLEALSELFQSNTVQALKPTLDEIDDLDRLKILLKTVPNVESLQEFKIILNEQEES